MKNAIRIWWTVVRGKLWRLALRRARAIVDAADEWIHAQEVSLRDAAAMADSKAEVDPVASAAREKAAKRDRKPRARRPRLKYQGGQFVRRES